MSVIVVMMMSVIVIMFMVMFMMMLVIVIVFMVVIVMMLIFIIMFMVVVVMMLMFVIMFMVVFMIMLMMMVMKEHLFSFFDTVDLHAHMSTRYPAFHGRGGFEYDPWYADRVYLIDEFRLFFLAQKLEESCCEHVSCSAHAAVYK